MILKFCSIYICLLGFFYLILFICPLDVKRLKSFRSFTPWTHEPPPPSLIDNHYCLYVFIYMNKFWFMYWLIGLKSLRYFAMVLCTYPYAMELPFSSIKNEDLQMILSGSSNSSHSKQISKIMNKKKKEFL